MAAPIINIQNVTRNKISDEAGATTAIATFTADQELTDWEARADGTGIGQGLLVGAATGVRDTWDKLDALNITWDQEDARNKTWDHINSVLDAGATGSFDVDYTELTAGDKVYRINVYGKNAANEWTPRAKRKVRYIRDWVAGSNKNAYHHWVEIQAIDFAAVNVAQGKTATSKDGTTSTIPTDGNTASSPYWGFGPGGSYYITIDLGAAYEIDLLKVWHYYADSRAYYGTKTEISLDGTNWETVYDSQISGTYIETSTGKIHQL